VPASLSGAYFLASHTEPLSVLPLGFFNFNLGGFTKAPSPSAYSTPHKVKLIYVRTIVALST